MEDSIAPLDTVALARSLATAAHNLQATDIVLIDLTGRVAYTDGFVVCSGKNRRHVVAIAEAVRMAAKTEYGIQAQGIEGKERGAWVLVDLGDLVVHVFEQSMRGFYDLDGLWADAPRWEGPPMAEPAEPNFFG